MNLKLLAYKPFYLVKFEFTFFMTLVYLVGSGDSVTEVKDERKVRRGTRRSQRRTSGDTLRRARYLPGFFVVGLAGVVFFGGAFFFAGGFFTVLFFVVAFAGESVDSARGAPSG